MTAIRVKALNDEVWTEMVRKDGKVFMNVYDGAVSLGVFIRTHCEKRNSC